MNMALMHCRTEGRIAASRGAGQHSNPYGGRDAGECGKAWDDGYRTALTERDELADEEIEGHR